MTETSLSLLDRVRELSNAQAWDQLVTLYAPLLKHWLRRYDIQDSDAADITQDVLAALLTEIPEFQHSQRPGAFRSWLRRILVYRVRRFWRSRDRQPLATGTSSMDERLSELQDDYSEVSQMWNREHDDYVLNRLMKIVRPQFAPETWQAFHRQVIGGQMADTVAHELGMSLSGVYMAKSRVLRALRQQTRGLVDEF